MLAVAIEIEVRRSQAIHQATHAAVLAAFDPKAGKAYHEALAGAMKGVRAAQGKKEKGHADQFLASLLKAAKKDG